MITCEFIFLSVNKSISIIGVFLLADNANCTAKGAKVNE